MCLQPHLLTAALGQDLYSSLPSASCNPIFTTYIGQIEEAVNGENYVFVANGPIRINLDSVSRTSQNGDRRANEARLYVKGKNYQANLAIEVVKITTPITI